MSNEQPGDKSISVLVAEDSPTQSVVITSAIERSTYLELIDIVEDGRKLLDYLAHDSSNSRPGLIVLDANLPRKDGLETLGDLKADAALRTIPVVMLFGSPDLDDIQSAYTLGANTCIIKPITVEQFDEVFECLGNYWSLAARFEE